jgi:hypothetical protein
MTRPKKALTLDAVTERVKFYLNEHAALAISYAKRDIGIDDIAKDMFTMMTAKAELSFADIELGLTKLSAYGCTAWLYQLRIPSYRQ